MNLSATAMYITSINSVYCVNTFIEKPRARCTNRGDYAIVYKLSGRVEYCFDGMTWDSHKDGVVFLSKGLDYTVSLHEAGECIAINFDLLDSPKLESFVVYPKNAEVLKKLFLQLNAMYLTRIHNGENKFMSVMYEILSELENCMRFRRISERNSEKIITASKYIEDHYEFSELKISDVAESVGMSDSRFRVLFSEVYGMSPIKYLNMIRLNKVKLLLVESKRSLNEIANATGFKDFHYLSRLFTKTIGMSMSEFRSSERTRNV